MKAYTKVSKINPRYGTSSYKKKITFISFTFRFLTVDKAKLLLNVINRYLVSLFYSMNYWNNSSGIIADQILWISIGKLKIFKFFKYTFTKFYLIIKMYIG